MNDYTREKILEGRVFVDDDLERFVIKDNALYLLEDGRKPQRLYNSPEWYFQDFKLVSSGDKTVTLSKLDMQEAFKRIELECPFEEELFCELGFIE